MAVTMCLIATHSRSLWKLISIEVQPIARTIRPACVVFVRDRTLAAINVYPGFKSRISPKSKVLYFLQLSDYEYFNHYIVV